MNYNGQKNHNGQQNVWITFTSENKDFLMSFRTRARKIASALHLFGSLWQDDDFGKRLMHVSLDVLEASRIPVSENRIVIMNHFMSVKEHIEYAVSLLIFGAEAGLLTTSNVVMVTPLCTALLGDLHDLETTLPFLFTDTTYSYTKPEPKDVTSELMAVLSSTHGGFGVSESRTQTPARTPKTPIVDTQAVVPQSAVRNNLKFAQELATATSDDAITYVSNSERRKSILSVLENRDSIAPQDLYEIMPSVSPKSIQRELQSLVGDGVLEKRGEKRWVTYHKI